jgi:hypothetical protein
MKATNKARSGILFVLIAGVSGWLFDFLSIVPDARATVAPAPGYVQSVQSVARNPSCSDQHWPYYDAGCLIDMTPDGAPRQVRVIDLAKRDVRTHDLGIPVAVEAGVPLRGRAVVQAHGAASVSALKGFHP